MKILETNRTILSEFETTDAAFILELINTPAWIEYIGDRNVKTLEAAEKYLVDGPIKSYEDNGLGLYKLSLKKNGTPIGMCGLVNRPTLEDIDVGFALLPGYEGKGYAFEAANATMDLAKNKLNLKRIVAITTFHNVRSQKLLERIGLKFEKKIKFDEEELMYYSVDFTKN